MIDRPLAVGLVLASCVCDCVCECDGDVCCCPKCNVCVGFDMSACCRIEDKSKSYTTPSLSRLSPLLLVTSTLASDRCVDDRNDAGDDDEDEDDEESRRLCTSLLLEKVDDDDNDDDRDDNEDAVDEEGVTREGDVKEVSLPALICLLLLFANLAPPNLISISRSCVCGPSP